MLIYNSGLLQSLNELVLFPFDSHSLPLQSGVELKLCGYNTPCGKTRTVLGLGEEGAPDCVHVVYYGSVQRVGDELWMWYLGQGPDEEWFERICLATSRDGYHWQKPNLGLVDYRGNRNNNLVDLNQGSHHVQSCVVLHDPDDPDVSRRFKLLFQSNKYNKKFAVAYSADGLTWQESPDNPVGSWMEMTGATRIGDCYYVCGHGGSHVGGFRQLVTYLSYDFENWTDASCMGLRRSNITPQPATAGRNAGQQIHLGASLWNRGNVILGFYGMWNGHPSNDRRLITMDLGLAVSNDALHYREPVADYPIVAAEEDGWMKASRGHHSYVDFPALVQGQGFENIGDETLFWYAPWPEHSSDGVRVASWPRDRLGYFRPTDDGRLRRRGGSHVVSAAIALEGKAAQIALNVDGIGEYSGLTVAVLDERFNPIPGYSAEDFVPLATSGLAQPISWQGRSAVSDPGVPIRLRIDFTGIRPEDVQLYAVYLNTTDNA